MNGWRGPIALILAVGVALALLAGVLAVSLTPRDTTPGEITFLSTLAGAVVGAVATYLGASNGFRPRGGVNRDAMADEKELELEPEPEGEPPEMTADVEAAGDAMPTGEPEAVNDLGEVGEIDAEGGDTPA